MAYKISDKAIIIESGGETILVAESFQYEDSITILNTDFTLSPTYISDYFPTPPVQGSISGHSVGGYPPVSPNGPNNSIDKFSFVSDANATDVGDVLQSSLKNSAGTSTLSDGYISGGSSSPVSPPYSDVNQNVIQKFSFASGGNTTDVGDLSSTTSQNSGLTDKSGDQSFIYQSKYPYATTSYLKFPFATGVGASAGTVLYHKSSKSEQVSATHGYTTGGKNVPPAGDVSIEKFAFASDGDGTDVGDMSFDTYGAGGTESENHGYTFGGVIPSPYSFYDNIDKINELYIELIN